MIRMSASTSSLPPTRRNLPLLQHAQDLDLQHRAHLADLVEEDRPLVGDLDAAPSGCASAPVNEPRMWPKSSESSSVSVSAPQLTATNGRSLRGDRTWMARRDQLLAGARLAGDQHRAAGRRDRLHHLEDLQHRAAVADDVVELVGRVHRPLQQHVLLLQALAVELLADAEAQDLGVERLLDVVVDAELRDAAQSGPAIRTR